MKRNFITQRKAAAVLKFEKALTETVHSQLLNRTLDLYMQVKNKLYPDRPDSSKSNSMLSESIDDPLTLKKSQLTYYDESL